MTYRLFRGWLHICKECGRTFFCKQRAPGLKKCPVCAGRFSSSTQVSINTKWYPEDEAMSTPHYPANFTSCTRYFEGLDEFFCPGTSHGPIINRNTGNNFDYEWVRLVPEVENAFYGENDDGE